MGLLYCDECQDAIHVCKCKTDHEKYGEPTVPVKPKIAPVQGYSAGIPWEMHMRAYDAYKKKYGAQPAMIDLEGRNCRGGFGTGELDMFIPGWREELSLVTKLNEEIVQLTSQCNFLHEKNQRLDKMLHSRDETLKAFDDLVDVLTEGYGAASCINPLTDMTNAIEKIRGILTDKEKQLVEFRESFHSMAGGINSIIGGE
jgi:hypothetical protein